MRNNGQRGFSLVELSIVLVIIGLLTGGIMAGRHLIHSTRLQAAPADAEALQSAIQSFRDAYSLQLPGDMYNAADYWSGAINGNGNGRIDYNSGALGEEHRAWQHLSLAEFIKGQYSGSDVTELPPGKLPNSHYRVSFQTGIYTLSGHFISLNAQGASGSANDAVLSPNDLRSMDRKLDDGMASTGWIMGFNAAGPTDCVDGPLTAASANYLSGDSVECKIYFRID